MSPEEQLAVELNTVDTWHWADDCELMLPDDRFTMQDREWQRDPLRCKAQKQVARKGSQMGWTTIVSVKSMHGMIIGEYPQGVLYLFPSDRDIADFTKSRFDPLISENYIAIGQHVKDTDNVAVKRIGHSTLYLRGARMAKKAKALQQAGIERMSDRLESIPVDRVVFDERDRMEEKAVKTALKRMGNSLVQQEMYLSTPTIPDWGVDKLYNESNQQVWMISCPSCGKETCLELEFPNCLKEREDGSVYRACIHCGHELHPCDGHWLAQYPDRSKDMVGWWISRLNNLRTNLAQILKDFEDPRSDKSVVYNYDLGMAYVAAENRLTVNDVYRICRRDAMLTRHPGPCCMGVDVGKMLHVVIGFHPTIDSVQAVKFAEVSTFDDVHDLAKRFHVTSAVIELEPEARKAREFQEAENYEIFLFDYNEFQRYAPSFDSKRGLVTMNRTELCDATHDLVTIPGRYEIPRRDSEVENYAKQMSNIAKVLEEDPETGSKSYRYRTLGDDHYRHATNFMLLAAMRIGVYEPERDKRQPKDKWGDWQEEGDERRGGFMGA